MKRFWRALTRHRGMWYWSAFLWATALVGLAGIPLVIYFPSTIPLVWLWIVGIPANSPIAPLFPTAFEPLMMEAVKYQPVLTVALVANGSFVYMEFINWHTFAWVLHWNSLERLRKNRWVRWGLKHFSRAPLLTVFMFATTPLPFWVARSLAILHKTPFWPYMAVMAVGRFPRLLVYAWIGSVLVPPTWLLISLALGTGLILIGWRLVRRQRLLQDSVLDQVARPTDPAGE